VKDTDEKESILKRIKDIAAKTKEQCIAILNDLSFNARILYFLPKE
jgi:hypothetical protein